MQLHELKRNNPLKKKKAPVGRGGKRGTYSGKGQKGQKARSGHRIRPAQRDLIQRLPKMRGYKNRIKDEKAIEINLDNLAKLNLKEISKKSLLDAGITKKIGQNVKILGTGDIKVAIHVKGIKISGSAKEKIVAAGGKVE